MSKVKRKHHYVPESLLAGFTKDGTKKSTLWVFDQETGQQRETKPKDAGFERDLYRVEISDTPSDALEDAFAYFESNATEVIKNIVSTLEFPKDHDTFNWLMNYIALQYVRTPARKEAFSKPMKDIAKNVMKMSLSTPDRFEKVIREMKEKGLDAGSKISYEKMRDFVFDEDKYTIEVDNNTKLKNMLSVIDSILPTLAKRNWSVVYSPPEIGDFICSDNPVSLHWTNGIKREGIFGSPGHGLPGTEVTIPLSSRVMLIGRYDNFQPPSGVVSSKRNLAILNSFTGIQSKRFVFSRKKNFYWFTKENRVGNTDDFIQMIKGQNQ